MAVSADSVLSAVSGPVLGFHDFHQLFHICREEVLVCVAQICFLDPSLDKILSVSLATSAAQLPYAADLAFFGKTHRLLDEFSASALLIQLIKAVFPYIFQYMHMHILPN